MAFLIALVRRRSGSSFPLMTRELVCAIACHSRDSLLRATRRIKLSFNLIVAARARTFLSKLSANKMTMKKMCHARCYVLCLKMFVPRCKKKQFVYKNALDGLFSKTARFFTRGNNIAVKKSGLNCWKEIVKRTVIIEEIRVG